MVLIGLDRTSISIPSLEMTNADSIHGPHSHARPIGTDEPFRRTKALAGEDAARGSHKFSTPASSQFLGRQDVAAAQFWTPIVHRVFPNR